MNLYDVLAGQGTTHFERLFSQKFAGGGKTQTMTGVPPLSFKADGTPLISWSMLGNGEQTGTPTPDAPIMPEFVGTLDGADWKIPLTCAGQTVPVYLGQVSTVRKIKKLVLTGTENFIDMAYGCYLVIDHEKTIALCTHLVNIQTGITESTPFGYFRSDQNQFAMHFAGISADDFKSFLAAQYAAGTPVTVWYVLAEPETAIVNEPLAKIGDYADELHSADAGVTIPTVKGQNTLTVDTDLQPSEMAITFKS